LDRYPAQFDGSARDDIGRLRFLLQQIAERNGAPGFQRQRQADLRAEPGKMALLRQEYRAATKRAEGLGDPNELARLAGVADGLEQAIWILEGRTS
jgi:hypothetical protein